MSRALLTAFAKSLNEHTDGRRKLKARAAVEDLLSAPEKTSFDQRAIALLANAAAELRQLDLFDGVLVIIDELGKFLEYAAMHPERQDVYFLQQLGEASGRSGDECLFTVGLLHQGFSSYADKLSEQGQREWEKVAGRFEEIVLSQPLSQVATLVKTALNVKEEACPRGWKSVAQQDMRAAVELGMFGANAGKGSLIDTSPGIYPLHPTVLPVLAKFFRRFGQNERSLFSFLLSSEAYALQDFAQRDATLDAVYRLHDFYDFISLNFGSRLSAQSFRSHWNHIDALIRSYPAERDLELRILKTVGLLNTIDSSSDLLASEELLEIALGSPKDLRPVLARLKKQNVIFFRGASRGLALWSHTSVNLEQALASATEKLPKSESIGSVVRERLDSRPIVARAHYIKTGNLRHFDVRFCSADEFVEEADRLAPKLPADGLIIIALCETLEQRGRVTASLQKFKKNDQVVVGVTDPLDALNGLALTVERWNWVERHTPELKDDRYAAEEVSRQIAHANQTLENALERYVGFRGKSASAESSIQWYHNGKTIKSVADEASLQPFLSGLCDRAFVQAPRIKNELVNRNSLSSAAAAARQRIFELMIHQGRQPMLGLPEDKAPPEKSLYLSVLKASGIHREGPHGWSIGFPVADPLSVRPALDHIVSILERQSDSRVTVDTIFDELRRPPFGVREGLLPILLLTVYLEHEAEVAVYEGGRFVSEMEEFLKMRLVKVPQSFEFQLCRINGIRRELLTHLASVMEVEHVERRELLSIVRPLCLFVAELKEYVRNTDKLSPRTLALRSAIANAKEPADLVFKAIPEALGMRVEGATAERLDATELASRLASGISELRRALPELRKRMTEVIREAFGEAHVKFTAWRHSVAERAETVIVGVTNPELRSFTLKLIDDATEDEVWLESLGSLVTRCPPSRWKDKDELAFAEGVQELVRQFLRVESLHFGDNSLAPEDAVRVALTRRTGEERDEIVHLSPADALKAAALRKELQLRIPSDKKVAAVALSQLLWDLLEDRS